MNKHNPLKVEASIFKSNRSQAVRIPKAMAFPDSVKKVTITEVDGGLLIRPVVQGTWAEYFASGPHVDADFLEDRMQGEWEEREPF